MVGQSLRGIEGSKRLGRQLWGPPGLRALGWAGWPSSGLRAGGSGDAGGAWPSPGWAYPRGPRGAEILRVPSFARL